MSVLEYVHVIAQFEQTPVAKLRAASTAAAAIELAIGSGTVEYTAFAAPGPQPGPKWKKKDTGYWLCAGQADSASAATTAVAAPDIDNQAIFVGYTRQHRGAESPLLDYDWSIECAAEMDVPAFQWDADLVSNVRIGLFEDNVTGRRSLREMTDALVHLSLEAGDVYYLFVDVAEARQTGADAVYIRGDRPTADPWCLSRAIERQLWEDLRKDRRNFVRGVFWGNYLGPRLLERLGGRADFRARYLEKAKTELREWKDLAVETPQGGLFVKISPNPLDESSRGMPRLGTATATWLHREFRRAGILL